MGVAARRAAERPRRSTRRRDFRSSLATAARRCRAADQKYDLIISEPSNPWLAGVSNLFTREFFRAAREHLTDDGVLAQWIQTYNFTLSDYLMIVRTLQSEFPHFGVIVLANGRDTVLLASNRPLVPDKGQLAALQKTVDASPEIDCRPEKMVWQDRLAAIAGGELSVGRGSTDEAAGAAIPRRS